jgi:hypothetical protein
MPVDGLTHRTGALGQELRGLRRASVNELDVALQRKGVTFTELVYEKLKLRVHDSSRHKAPLGLAVEIVFL